MDPAVTEHLVPLGGATIFVRRFRESRDPRGSALIFLHDSLGRRHVARFSTGAHEAAWTRRRGVRPARLRAIVTVRTRARTTEYLEAEARESFATTNLAERLARYHGDKVVAIADAWINTWLSPSFRAWNIERYLPDVRCPVLAIQGSDDEFGTIAQVNAIVAGVGARAKALMIPGIGHTPHREACDAVLTSATAFILDAISS